jgi:hypothetical protein
MKTTGGHRCKTYADVNGTRLRNQLWPLAGLQKHPPLGPFFFQKQMAETWRSGGAGGVGYLQRSQATQIRVDGTSYRMARQSRQYLNLTNRKTLLVQIGD